MSANTKSDFERWIDGEVTLGRLIYNAGLESCYTQASNFAGGIANAYAEKILALTPPFPDPAQMPYQCYWRDRALAAEKKLAEREESK